MSIRRMDGPFAVLPYEVMDILDNVSLYAERVYRNLLRLKMKVDTDQPGEWATGTTIYKVKKTDITRRSKMSRWTFYDSWKELIDSGLIIENNDGSITITMLYKKRKGKDKENSAMSDIKRLIKMNSQIMEQIISKMAEIDSFGNIEEKESDTPELFDEKSEKKVLAPATFLNLTDLKIDEVSGTATFFDDDDAKVSVPATQSEKKLSVPATSFDEVSVPATKNDKNVAGTGTRSLDSLDLKISLSLISLFYTTIGQKKISKEKRERGLKSYEEMRKEGFTDDQIEFAVKWTLENVKDIYDFKIIKSTISQALAKKEEYEGKERIKGEKQAEKALHEEEERKSAEEAEHYRLLKEKMTPEERVVLRQNAFALAEKRKMMREFLKENTIEALENEILMESEVIDHGNRL